MIRLVVTVAAAALLAGCAGKPRPEPIIDTREVVVPGKPVACVPSNLNAAPVYPDTDAALRKAKDAAERYRLMSAGRPLRVARLRELEPVVEGCK